MNQPSNAPNTGLIPGLNGLRAVSILLVIGCHAIYRNSLGNAGVLADGQLGVTVFFLLSGFLITTLLLKEERKYGTVSAKNFFLRRTLRIFPAYYALLLIYGLLQSFHLFELSDASWLTSITYTKYFNRKLDWETSHLWSLSVEEHFYILWIICFKFLGRYRKTIAFVLVGLAPAFRVFDYLSPTIDLTNLHFLTRMDGMLWGCILALYYPDVTRYVNKRVNRSKLWLLVPFAALGGLLVLTPLNLSYHLHIGIPEVAFGGEVGTITDIAIALVIVLTIEYQTLWSRLMNLFILEWLGKLSYSLYLWQQLFFSDIMISWFSQPVRFAMIMAAAVISFYLVEKPLLRFKERFTAKPPMRLEAEVPVQSNLVTAS